MLLPVDYQKIKKSSLFIDVRSQGEFKSETIPGAINMPIFDDEERKLIGTLYKQVSEEDASREGIKIASKKLLYFYDEVLKLKKKHRDIVFFCARGGMRSGVISTFINSMGINVIKLKGGYKSYRRAVIDELPELNDNVEYVVIHGNTGVGKTKILKELEELGLDMLDLEGAANHRGSLLGNVGLGSCNSQKMFESIIHNTLGNAKSKYVFVEAESKRIGKVFVPSYIHDKMKNGKHIFVDADIDFRADIILEDYTKSQNCQQEIIECLEKLNKYISSSRIEEYKNQVLQGKYKEVTKDLMIKYYDPMYMNTSTKYEYDLEIMVKDIKKTTLEIAKWAETL